MLRRCYATIGNVTIVIVALQLTVRLCYVHMLQRGVNGSKNKWKCQQVTFYRVKLCHMSLFKLIEDVQCQFLMESTKSKRNFS